ncbi:unnamed protein product [Paramecium sonneborni]|uniref:Uncharacterized protein n=1 Tax=Paramecium sonneborni TaxID=65129 RepID=A0A8S1QTE6_9CILI|nr:unnamed protein product [Paramecium sonneborni]
MTKEEIKEVVEAYLVDRFDKIWGKIKELEKKIQECEGKLTQQQTDNDKNLSIQNQNINEIESKFRNLITILEETQRSANQVIEKTALKLKEIENVKKNQQQKLEQLAQIQNYQQQILVSQQQQQQNQAQLQQQVFLQQNKPNQQEIQEYQIQTLQQAPEGMVFRMQNGNRYHRLNCENVKKFKSKMITRHEAEQSQLTKCQICKP